MDIVITILVLLIPLYVAYKMYEPRIDVVMQSKQKVVLLWYNVYVDGHPTGERAYKKLFTI